MSQQVRLGDLLGAAMEEDYNNFDMTEIEEVLGQLREVDAIDLAHAELFQQQALRCADILAIYLGKIVKTVAYLEAKVNSTKNRVSLDYTAPNGVKTTLDMKKWAGESSSEVEKVQIQLASAKGSKVALEKKYDILIKAHHHFKDISAGMRKTILGYSLPASTDKVPEGYE